MDFRSEMLAARVRRLRLQKEIGIEQLARDAGVDKNTIVRIEKGEGRPNLKTLVNICNALGVSVDKLIDMKALESEDYFVHRRKGKKSKAKDSEPGLRVGDLNAKLPYGIMNTVVLEIFGEGKMRSHKGEELLFCLKGRVGVRIGSTPVVLNKGDSILFFGREPHLYFNADKSGNSSEAVALSVWLDEDVDPETHQLKQYHI
ncbi:MAG TPA: XRE family transcriptional regulator [archaeon]|nr:XRE family transcriptional regulator [archaeon]